MNQEATNWDEYLRSRRTNAYTDKQLIASYLKGDLLELGCGFGDFAAWCAAQGGCRVTGIDPSAEAIEIATKAHPEVRFDVAEAEHLPYPDASFDSLVTLEVIEHVKDPLVLFAESFRVLRPGGVLIVQTPNYPVKRVYDFLNWVRGHAPNMKDDPTHISPLSVSRLTGLAKQSRFTIVKVVGRNILGENLLHFLTSFKRTGFGLLFAQKTILICRKPL